MDGFSPHIRLKGNHMKINKEKLRKTVFAGINKTWEFTLMIVKKTLFLLVEEAAKIQTKIDRGLQMRKDIEKDNDDITNVQGDRVVNIVGVVLIFLGVITIIMSIFEIGVFAGIAETGKMSKLTSTYNIYLEYGSGRRKEAELVLAFTGWIYSFFYGVFISSLFVVFGVIVRKVNLIVVRQEFIFRKLLQKIEMKKINSENEGGANENI